MNIIYLERGRVATLNVIWGVLKWFFYAIWGMVMVDITPMITKESIQALEMFDSFENTAKTFTAIAGLVYFIKNLYDYFFIELPHKKKKYNLETKIMEEDLESKEYENSKNVKKKVITRKNYGFPVSVLLSK